MIEAWLGAARMELKLVDFVKSNPPYRIADRTLQNNAAGPRLGGHSDSSLAQDADTQVCYISVQSRCGRWASKTRLVLQH
jgi:hypothetical protein